MRYPFIVPIRLGEKTTTTRPAYGISCLTRPTLRLLLRTGRGDTKQDTRGSLGDDTEETNASTSTREQKNVAVRPFAFHAYCVSSKGNRIPRPGLGLKSGLTPAVDDSLQSPRRLSPAAINTRLLACGYLSDAVKKSDSPFRSAGSTPQRKWVSRALRTGPLHTCVHRFRRKASAVTARGNLRIGPIVSTHFFGSE